MSHKLRQAVAYHNNLTHDLWLELREFGIPDAYIHARLIGWDDSRVTIPVFSRDKKLVSFEYVYFDEEDELRVLSEDPRGPFLYGEPIFNCSPQQVIVTEGVVENLILSGQSFNTVSATGNGREFKEEWALLLHPIREVFVCFKRGKESRIAAQRIGEMVPHAQLVELPGSVPEGKGVAYFFGYQQRSRQDFVRLLALTPSRHG